MLRAGGAALHENASLRCIVLLPLVTTAFGGHLLVLYQPYFLRPHVPGVCIASPRADR